MAVARVQSTDREINQLQTNIIGAIEPVLKNPLLGGVIFKCTLKAGLNTIAHGLGRRLQGWHVVRLRSESTIYDEQDTNTTPEKTLLLNASSSTTVDIFVF